MQQSMEYIASLQFPQLHWNHGLLNHIESETEMVVRFTILTSLVENTEMKSILVANHTGSKFELLVNDPSEGYLVKNLVKIASLVLRENPPETFKHFNR